MRSTDKNPTKTTRIIKIVVIGATIVITLAAMRYINAKIEGVKHRVIYARRKARQAKLAGADVDAGNSSSRWSTFPQDDAEAQASTPFMPVAQRDSMDVVPPSSNVGAQAASGGYEQRYDDPYAGGGVDIAAMSTPGGHAANRF